MCAFKTQGGVGEVSTDGKSPEERLLVAVMVQAVHDLHTDIKTHGLVGAWAAEAGRWIRCDDTRPWGFIWCCSILGMQPERVRARVAHRDVRQRLRTWDRDRLTIEARERARQEKLSAEL